MNTSSLCLLPRQICCGSGNEAGYSRCGATVDNGGDPSAWFNVCPNSDFLRVLTPGCSVEVKRADGQTRVFKGSIGGNGTGCQGWYGCDNARSIRLFRTSHNTCDVASKRCHAQRPHKYGGGDAGTFCCATAPTAHRPNNCPGGTECCLSPGAGLGCQGIPRCDGGESEAEHRQDLYECLDMKE